jgi:hypothetical protein
MCCCPRYLSRVRGLILSASGLFIYLLKLVYKVREFFLDFQTFLMLVVSYLFRFGSRTLYLPGLAAHFLKP